MTACTAGVGAIWQWTLPLWLLLWPLVFSYYDAGHRTLHEAGHCGLQSGHCQCCPGLGIGTCFSTPCFLPETGDERQPNSLSLSFSPSLPPSLLHASCVARASTRVFGHSQEVGEWDPRSPFVLQHHGPGTKMNVLWCMICLLFVQSIAFLMSSTRLWVSSITYVSTTT